MKATSIQVGGSHYKSGYQPIELICKMQMNFIQGNILKYPSRFTKKNGQEDLNKAIHYAQLGNELSPANFSTFSRLEAIKYVKKNELPSDFVEFIEQICRQNWPYIIAYVENLSNTAYGK